MLYKLLYRSRFMLLMTLLIVMYETVFRDGDKLSTVHKVKFQDYHSKSSSMPGEFNIKKVRHEEHYKLGQSRSQTYVSSNIQNQQHGEAIPKRKCNIPNFKLWPDEFKEFLGKAPASLKCSKDTDWVYIDNGTYRFSKEARKNHGDFSCKATTLVRDGDFNVVKGKTITSLKDENPLISDFSEVTCAKKTYNNDNTKTITFRTVLPGIARTENLPKIKEEIRQEHLNVLILGYDSVSRMRFMRELPETYKYLIKKLGVTVLKGYNIVGDGTPAALLPILTGKDEETLPEARRGHDGAKPVDNHPWIWREMTPLGYVTQYGEDYSEVNTFTYRMLGFDKQPTHHYMRPFYLYSKKQYQKHLPYCLGSVPRHVNMLNWILELYKTYPDRPKFSFLFHSEYSHDPNESLARGDKKLLAFLKTVTHNGYLDKTVLIIMSDHGTRFAKVRETTQGKYEERMPFFSFRFPNWFKIKHREAIMNLQRNIDTLTTPYDIHETLRNIVHISEQSKQKFQSGCGRSLLQEIPADRDCLQAGISAHWCTCMKSEIADMSDIHILSAARHLIKSINDLIKLHQEICREVKLQKILSSEILHPNERLLKFNSSMDIHGRVPIFNNKTDNKETFFRIVVETLPCFGKFEATVKHSNKTGSYSVTSQDISRINSYHGQHKCIQEQYPHLRKYCCCRNFKD